MHNLTDWNIMNNLLSTLSALFVVLNCSNDRCPQILSEVKISKACHLTYDFLKIHRILFADNIEIDDATLTATKRHAIGDLLRLVTDFLPAVLVCL